ncbi:MAG: vWA domain-containing protein [Verrucomicrobiota bacterium]
MLPKKRKLNLPLIEVVIISLVIHVVGLLVLGGITVWQSIAPEDPVAEAPPIPPPDEVEEQKVRVKTLQKKSAPPTKVVSVTVPQDVPVPVVDINLPKVDGRVAVGGGGAGGGFGGGNGMIDFAVSNVNFFNIKDKGERVLFIIDCSGSMSAQVPTGETRFELLKQQLNAAVGSLSANIFVEMIYFSGPAWVSGERDGSQRQNYNWDKTTKNNWHTYHPKDLKNISDPSWKRMTMSEKRKLVAEVNNLSMSGGTVWSNPFYIAKKLDPAPELIFFLTDGSTTDEDASRAFKLVSEWRRKNRDLRINTIALGEPKAAEGMRSIARRTGGKFQLIESKDDIKVASNDG